MEKTNQYLCYIEDSLKLNDGTSEEINRRLFRIWARLTEYLSYSDVSFEKFIREMGYDEESEDLEDNEEELEENEHEDDEDSDEEEDENETDKTYKN